MGHVGKLAATLASAVGIVGAVACSSSNGGSSVSVSQACSDLASALCNRIQSCAPFLVEIAYGDVGACEQATQGPCADAVKANGSGANASDVESCAQAYSSASCTAIETNETPSACQIHGSLAAGAACGSGIQCSGDSYCNVGSNAVCGVCAARVGSGGGCRSDSDCQQGLVCHTGSGAAGSCVAPVAQGGSCTAGGTPCQTPLVCVSGTCQTPAGAGQTCDKTAQNCDFTQGLFCGQSGKCTAAAVASPGQACGLLNGTYTLCKAGSTCATGANGMGTCTATAANGAACGSNGEGCMPGAVCVNNACTVPDASSCH